MGTSVTTKSRMSLKKTWMSKTMKTMPGNQMSSKTGTRLLIDKLELSKSFLFRQAWIMILIKLKRKVICFL
jgi:hypothetical protein